VDESPSPPDRRGGGAIAVEGCWTGECLDCMDGCQADGDCVVVRSCGCSYHEGCSWAVTVYRQALETDACNVGPRSPCPDGCPTGACPTACEEGQTDHCCDWCDYDRAECVEGRCQGVVEHMCM